MAEDTLVSVSCTDFCIFSNSASRARSMVYFSAPLTALHSNVKSLSVTNPSAGEINVGAGSVSLYEGCHVAGAHSLP